LCGLSWLVVAGFVRIAWRVRFEESAGLEAQILLMLGVPVWLLGMWVCVEHCVTCPRSCWSWMRLASTVAAPAVVFLGGCVAFVDLFAR
jgi:hypothetical protein